MKNRNVEYMRIPSPFFLTLALKDPRAMFFVPQLEKVSLVIPNNTVLEVLYKSDKSEYPVPKSWSAQGERTPAGAGWGPLPKTPRTGKTRRTIFWVTVHKDCLPRRSRARTYPQNTQNRKPTARHNWG